VVRVCGPRHAQTRGRHPPGAKNTERGLFGAYRLISSALAVHTRLRQGRSGAVLCPPSELQRHPQGRFGAANGFWGRADTPSKARAAVTPPEARGNGSSAFRRRARRRRPSFAAPPTRPRRPLATHTVCAARLTALAGAGAPHEPPNAFAHLKQALLCVRSVLHRLARAPLAYLPAPGRESAIPGIPRQKVRRMDAVSVAARSAAKISDFLRSSRCKNQQLHPGTSG
jgi:hypothetical protein